MDVIELAREIGKLLQNDELYISMEIARQASDDDEELQRLISDFNLKRIAINNEAMSPERNDEKLQQLNKEMRLAYTQIMQNKNMMAYNEKKTTFDNLVQRIVAIITQSAQGENPETTDYSPSCTGSCSSCSGCE